MYCIHCGLKLPAEAKFCYSCGIAQPEMSPTNPQDAPRQLVCEIVYQTIGEKWGIFPRDVGEFQARLVRASEINGCNTADNIVCKSPKIEIMSCSFSPDSKSKKHNKALEVLVKELLQAGWVQQNESGNEWYNLTFTKNC